MDVSIAQINFSKSELQCLSRGVGAHSGAEEDSGDQQTGVLLMKTRRRQRNSVVTILIKAEHLSPIVGCRVPCQNEEAMSNSTLEGVPCACAAVC